MVEKHSIRFWSIPYVSVAFFPSLKQNFIAYRSSKVSSRPDYIFENPQLWQSGFSRVYSNCCCSCWFEAEIIKIGQSCHKIYSNNILNFQESTTILNACTKKSGNLLKAPRTNCDWCVWHGNWRIIKGPGGFGSWWPSGDHLNSSIIENAQNTEKSPRDLRRLAVTQSPVKDHQPTLMWKTLMSK